jgi:hypothetical protein
VLLNKNIDTGLSSRFESKEYMVTAGFKMSGNFLYHLTYHKHKALNATFICKQGSVVSDIICILGALHIGFVVPSCSVIPTSHEVQIELYKIFQILLTKQLV